MADFIDDAQALNELHEKISLLNHKLGQEKSPAYFNGCNCIECEDMIDPRRLKHGYFRCVGCQDLHESDMKRWRIAGRA